MKKEELKKMKYKLASIPGEIKRTSPKFNQWKLAYGDWAGDKNVFTEKVNDNQRTYAFSVKEGMLRTDAVIGAFSAWDKELEEVEITIDDDFDKDLFECEINPVFLNLGDDYELQYFSLKRKEIAE